MLQASASFFCGRILCQVHSGAVVRTRMEAVTIESLAKQQAHNVTEEILSGDTDVIHQQSATVTDIYLETNKKHTSPDSDLDDHRWEKGASAPATSKVTLTKDELIVGVSAIAMAVSAFLVVNCIAFGLVAYGQEW